MKTPTEQADELARLVAERYCGTSDSAEVSRIAIVAVIKTTIPLVQLLEAARSATYLRDCNFWNNDCPEWVDSSLTNLRNAGIE